MKAHKKLRKYWYLIASITIHFGIFKQYYWKIFAKLLVIQNLFVVMSKVLGIIGGGQLGMMITEAAQNMKNEDLYIAFAIHPTMKNDK